MGVRRYIIVFFITAAIFLMAFWISAQFSERKLNQLQSIQQTIAVDILSIETRFALLGASSCEHVLQGDDIERELTRELSDVARRVKFLESELSPDDESLLTLKKQYAILQAKDFLLTRELAQRCGADIATILYFHEQECGDCQKQSIVLDEIGERYPSVRIYWLDNDLETPVMQTLTSMFAITSGPALVIEDALHEGLQDVESIETLLPEWIIESSSTSTKDLESTD